MFSTHGSTMRALALLFLLPVAALPYRFHGAGRNEAGSDLWFRPTLAGMNSTLCMRSFAGATPPAKLTAGSDLDGAALFAAIERHQNPPDCGAAKFVVTAFPFAHGIGMALKEGPVAAVLFALATQRVLVFANNRKTPRHRSLRKPLTFASCPAKYMSCDFLPMSPCQVTDDELDNRQRVGPGNNFFKIRFKIL